MAICPSGHESASDDYCDVCGMLIGTAVLAPLAQAPGSMLQAPGRMPGQGPFKAPGGFGTAEGACPRCGVPRAGQFCESCGFDFTAASTGGTGSAAWTGSAGPGAVAPTVRDLSPIPQPAAPSRVVPPPPLPPTAPLPPDLSPSPSPSALSSRLDRLDLDRLDRLAPSANGAPWTVVVTADRAYYDSVQADGGPDAGAIGFPAYCPERRFRLAGTEVRVGRRSESRGIHPEIDLTGPPADPGVSRLHAVLVAAPDGTWSVVDPGSANGTLVNGGEIPPGAAVPLRDGDVIHLGAWTALTITSG